MKENELWPPNRAAKDTDESEREAKTAKLIRKAAVEDYDSLEHVLEKFTFKKVIKITARVKRFIANCKTKRNAGK